MSSRSGEAVWWSLFSAGGVLSALFVPALIICTGFILPFRDAAQFERVQLVLANPIAKIVLLGVAAMTFFHSAHRMRHTMIDFGLRRFSIFLGFVWYAIATGLTALAAVALLGITTG